MHVRELLHMRTCVLCAPGVEGQCRRERDESLGTDSKHCAGKMNTCETLIALGLLLLAHVRDYIL